MPKYNDTKTADFLYQRRLDTLNEDCDRVTLPSGKILNYDDSDALAFLYFNGYKLMVSDVGDTHFSLLRNYYESTGNYSSDELKKQYFDKSKFKGRIWVKNKVLSFWDQISPTDLIKVIGDLETFLDIKIDVNNWSLDYCEDTKICKSLLIKISDYLSDDKYNKNRDSVLVSQIPYGYGSRFSRHKPLNWKQFLQQEKNVYRGKNK